MSVVSGPDFDELKRFNLAEIGMPPTSATDANSGKLKDEAPAESGGVAQAEIKVEEAGKAADSRMPSAPAADEKDVKMEDTASTKSDDVVKTEVRAEEE